jgi:signal transduction histidine kinase
MKKVALVFVIAVIVPSLVLAWLALRSLRDQQILVHHQQSASYQSLADGLARQLNGTLAERRREFNQQVDELIGQRPWYEVANQFDGALRQRWPLAEVGFVVSLEGEGKVLSPSLFAGPETRMFRLENDRFLCNKEAVEVSWNSPELAAKSKAGKEPSRSKIEPAVEPPASSHTRPDDISGKSVFATKSGKVSCISPADVLAKQDEAEFRHLVGDSSEGTMARFLQNKLKLLFWYRPPRDCQLVFGAQVHLPRLVKELEGLFELDPDLQKDVTVALLDDTGRPRFTSNPRFGGDWKRPFVSAAVGEVLPHWAIGVHLNNPAKLSESARTFRLTLGLLISVLLLAIAIGGWLIVSDLRREIALSRQKTDFVSNVSHELKTPLTSIRMFSELLAEGRVQDEKRRREYLGVITTETARLSRLINNVLDFARMERDDNKYRFNRCDLVALLRDTVETYRPHLEASGFTVQCDLPDQRVEVNGDCDALAQVLVNLISNAEKYSAEKKEITVVLSAQKSEAIIQILDRGMGVPAGCHEKIFEQFYRAHDSLSSGIQGSGLGLTLARQIARAHGGDVAHQARVGGGSSFVFTLPLNLTSRFNDSTI